MLGMLILLLLLICYTSPSRSPSKIFLDELLPFFQAVITSWLDLKHVTCPWITKLLFSSCVIMNTLKFVVYIYNLARLLEASHVTLDHNYILLFTYSLSRNNIGAGVQAVAETLLCCTNSLDLR